MDHLDIPLKFYNEISEEILNIETHEIRSIFPDPSIIELKGKKKEAIFLSILLHGNEQSSFYILQKIITFFKKNTLPRTMIIFIGNVYAAEKKKRYLHGQKDYNRIWEHGLSKEHQLSKKVLTWIKNHKPFFACIDIHNTTGINPYYACINETNKESMYLASQFSDIIVYFKNPATALSMALSKIAPSVTLECGQSEDREGIERAFQFILNIIHLDSLEHPVPKSNIFRTTGKIQVSSEIKISFAKNTDFSSEHIYFPENFDHLNFKALNKGDYFASYNGEKVPLRVFDDNNKDISSSYFTKISDKILIAQDLYPSMFTKSKEAIQKDCLGYFMKKISVSENSSKNDN